MRSDFNWLNDLLKRSQGGGSSQKVEFLKIPTQPGSIVKVRLFPITPQFVFPRFQHWLNRRPIVCLKTFGEDCPICKVVYSEGDDEIKQKYKPQRQILWVVLKVLNDNQVEDKPYILSITPSFLESVYDYHNLEGIDPADPKEGIVMVLKRKSDGKIEKLPTQKKIDISEYVEKYNDIDLSKFVKKPSNEELQKAVDYIKGKIAETQITEEEKIEKEIESFNDIDGVDLGNINLNF